MEKNRKFISKFYYESIMDIDCPKWKLKLIPLIKYYLFPEFIKKNFYVKKRLKYVMITFSAYFFLSIIVNNFVLSYKLQNKQFELNESHFKISLLYNDAKALLFNECMDSLLNTKNYIRYKIYEKSGIIIPPNVPKSHLIAIQKNAEEMGIPLFIYVRVINQESSFDSSAINSTSGAEGYMQLMPQTFKHLYNILLLKGGNTTLNNLICGSTLLKQNYIHWYKIKRNKKQAWEMALACYAMGDYLPRKLGRVPDVVKDYVNYVMNKKV